MTTFRTFIDETYTMDLAYLRKYLRTKPLDLASHSHMFVDWPGSRAVMARAKVPRKIFDDPEFNDEYYQAIDRIEKAMSPAEVEDFVGHILHHEPQDAPTWSHMSYRATVAPSTWLVHFTDDPDSIWNSGFTHGTDDVTKLGLTTHFGIKSKQYGGYNFAFRANSKYAVFAARDRKYGKHAVMFRAGGVEADHYGDQELQVMFDGRAVPPKSVIILRRTDDEWDVETSPESKMWQTRSAAFKGNFQAAVAWVEQNYQQYRRHL